MTGPTKSLNGSDFNQLYEENRAAAEALREAVIKLKITAPNGRDYPSGGLEAARVEFVDRLDALRGVMEELDEAAEIIVDQMD